MRHPKTRRVRRSGLGAALLRAGLLAGPLALAIAFGISPGTERPDRMLATLAPDGLDAITTGSIAGCAARPAGIRTGAC